MLSSQFFASRENKVLCFCCWAEVGWVIEREKRSFSLEITQPTSAKQPKHWTLVSRDAKNWLGSTETKKLSWRTVKIKQLKQKKHVKSIRRKKKWGLWFYKVGYGIIQSFVANTKLSSICVFNIPKIEGYLAKTIYRCIGCVAIYKSNIYFKKLNTYNF